MIFQKILFLLVLISFLVYGQDSENVIKHCNKAKLLFETEAVFQTPESVVYDVKNNLVYVSNFNSDGGFSNYSDTTRDEFISKVNLKGEILELKWIDKILKPTGMAIYNDKLYIVERGKLVEVDITKGEIITKYDIPNSKIANDIIFSDKGIGYITDNGSSETSIYKFENGEVVSWIDSSLIKNPNGINYRDNYIYAGDKFAYTLKSINVDTKEIKTIGIIPEDKAPGIFDGVMALSDGSFITTSWSGAGFYYNNGNICKFMDTKELQSENRETVNNADSYFIEEKRLLVIPTFMDNRVLFYSFE